MGNVFSWTVVFVSKCFLALTLPTSGCTDAHQTAASSRVDISRVCCFFPLETESKLILQWEDTLYKNKGLMHKMSLSMEDLDTALKCAVVVCFRLF